MGELRGHFRPEFLNRVDEVVFFTPLLAAQLKEIIDLMLSGLRRRLAERKITLVLTESAKDLVVEQAYEPSFGARPLRRYLQARVETPLAKALIAGTIADGGEVTVDAEDGALVVR
jgi:ATP-dependent Clp protease ATP-binding subunit ClpB